MIGADFEAYIIGSHRSDSDDEVEVSVRVKWENCLPCVADTLVVYDVALASGGGPLWVTHTVDAVNACNL